MLPSSVTPLPPTGVPASPIPPLVRWLPVPSKSDRSFTERACRCSSPTTTAISVTTTVRPPDLCGQQDGGERTEWSEGRVMEICREGAPGRQHVTEVQQDAEQPSQCSRPMRTSLTSCGARCWSTAIRQAVNRPAVPKPIPKMFKPIQRVLVMRSPPRRFSEPRSTQWGQPHMERKTGFEPATLTLARCLSSSTGPQRVF